MHPIIFKIGFVTIYSYGFFAAVSFLTVVFLLSLEFKKAGLKKDLAVDLCFYLLVSGIIGARFLHVVLNADYYLDNLKEIFMLQHGGLAWQGGFGAACAAGFFFLKRNHLNIGQICDIVIPYAVLGQAIGRIGCYFNGCCYGKETNFVLGVILPGMKETAHPAQLYSSFLLVLLFLILKNIERKKYFDWQVFFSYLMLYSVMRFSLDFLRGDLPVSFLGLTVSQVISVISFFIGVFFYLKKRCCKIIC